MKIAKFLLLPIQKIINKKAEQIAEAKIRENFFIPIDETQDNDIFIASYPKSGVTWLQNLLTNILLESTSFRINQRLVNEIIPDVHMKKYYKRFFPVMFFKTHHLPKSSYKRVIHLVRDGRDVMVSYYFMYKNMDPNFPYTLEDMIIKGKALFPTKWHIHTRQWIDNPFNAQIIRVRYEDLLSNPLDTLKKICQFSEIEISDDMLNKIIEANKIDVLRKKMEVFGTDNEAQFKNKNVKNFFRKGVAGDYKNHLSQELIDFFTKEAYSELKYFNYV